MAITSTVFIMFFLPVSLGIYYFSRDSVKEFVLLIISLLFYACGSLQFLMLFIVSAVITVCLGRMMAEHREKRRVALFLMVIGIVWNTAILCYYKYLDFGLTIFAQISKIDVTLRNLALPMGISFFTFKAISYLVDIYKGTALLADSPVHDLLYLSLFTQVQSGPLSRYNEMGSYLWKQDQSKHAKFEHLSAGLYRFLIGLNKKVILANVLANITSEVFNAESGTVSTLYLWLGAICYSMQLFFDFAGYSDMAIGLSEMFGYGCTENFNYPYMTESVAKFWRRWHISLSSWFRDYIYIPLGGSRCKKWRVYLNLFVVWALTGIWHGAAWNFIFWGIGYFVLIAFEKATGLPERLHSKAGKAVYRVFTLLFVNFQWVMFNSTSLRSGASFIKHMIVYTPNLLADRRALFLMQDNWFFILVGILLCFPIVPYVEKKLEQKKRMQTAYRVLIGTIVVFGAVWSISFIISGQNNPFAYANF